MVGQESESTETHFPLPALPFAPDLGDLGGDPGRDGRGAVTGRAIAARSALVVASGVMVYFPMPRSGRPPAAEELALTDLDDCMGKPTSQMSIGPDPKVYAPKSLEVRYQIR